VPGISLKLFQFELLGISGEQTASVITIDYSVQDLLALVDRVDRCKCFHLLDYSLADLTMILNNEDISGAEKQPLDLVTVFP